MNKKIFCNYLKKFEEQQDFQSYPGKLGKYIFSNISKSAWNKWKITQTKLINEKQLNMMNIDHRKLLKLEMIKFLFKNNEM